MISRILRAISAKASSREMGAAHGDVDLGVVRRIGRVKRSG
jgi:hypothetical protein